MRIRAAARGVVAGRPGAGRRPGGRRPAVSAARRPHGTARTRHLCPHPLVLPRPPDNDFDSCILMLQISKAIHYKQYKNKNIL